MLKLNNLTSSRPAFLLYNCLGHERTKIVKHKKSYLKRSVVNNPSPPRVNPPVLGC